MKRNCVIGRLAFVLLACVMMLLALPVSAERMAPGVPAEEGRYVYDQDWLLSEADQWEAEIRRLREELQIDIVIVTTGDAEGLSSQEYADDFYDYNNFGYDQPRGDGVLFLIDMDNRQAYLSTCGRAIDYFTDARIDAALDEIVEELGDGDYDGACEVFLERTEKYMRYAEGAKLSYGERLQIVLEDRWLPLLVIAVITAGITVLIMVRSAQGGKVAAGVYMDPKNGFHLTVKQDQYMGEFTTSRKIPKSDGGSGGGGGSSTHHSSSGTSHGGGGRSF